MDQKTGGPKPPRQHHIVPAVYLDGFCATDTDRLVVLDLQTGEIRKQKPSKVMRRRDYFRQRHAPEGVDEFILEREKANRFEAQLKTIIGKLCRGGHELSEEELILFIQHLEMQLFTVPKQVEFLKSIGDQVITKIALKIPEVADGLRKGLWKLKMKDEYKFAAWRKVLKDGKMFTFISRMVWHVWDVPDGYSFITSDNPVNIFNPNVATTEVAGIGLLGSTMLFPLNSTHCLELSHPESFGESSGNPRTPLDVESFDGSGVLIRAGQTMPSDLAYVTNCLQGLHAERFIVGNDVDILLEIYESVRTGEPSPKYI